jgi:hypothetical protein
VAVAWRLGADGTGLRGATRSSHQGVTEALSIPQKKSDPGLLRGPTYTARGLHPIVPPSWFHNMTSVADIKRRAIAAPVQIGKLSSVRCGFSADVAGSVHGAFAVESYQRKAMDEEISASNGCSRQKRPAPKWGEPIQTLPKSHNHCAEVLAGQPSNRTPNRARPSALRSRSRTVINGRTSVKDKQSKRLRTPSRIVSSTLVAPIAAGWIMSNAGHILYSRNRLHASRARPHHRAASMSNVEIAKV